MSTDPADHAAVLATGVGSGVANEDTCASQWIYGPVRAASLAGALKGVLAAREASASSDARAQMIVRIIARDGSVRGTPLGMDASALSNEFLVSTTATRSALFPLNWTGSGATLSRTSMYDGDFIVIEVGFRNHGTNTGNVRVTTPSAPYTNGDFPENETTTPGANYRAWFEFSQDIKLWTPKLQPVVHDVGVAVL
jgi:hypothetical protein